MVTIDHGACVGCGLCVRDCFEKNLVIEDGIARVLGTCFECGHCIAVCPKNACAIDDMPTDGIRPVSTPPDPDALFGAICSRRSIRRYRERPVEREKIERLIEAARFTPTGSNAQDVEFVVVQESLEAVKPYIWQGVDAIASKLIDAGTPGLYAYRWRDMAAHYRRDPKNKRDDLFFEAPLLLVLTGTDTSCALAAASIDLMASALGLGMLYSGFIRRGISNSSEAKSMLGLDADPAMCLLIGYPDVTYLRTVPRKKAHVLWK